MNICEKVSCGFESFGTEELRMANLPVSVRGTAPRRPKTRTNESLEAVERCVG